MVWAIVLKRDDTIALRADIKTPKPLLTRQPPIRHLSAPKKPTLLYATRHPVGSFRSRNE